MAIRVISCIIYKKSKKQIDFLLLKRTLKKGGFWQPPGGKVENDETLLDACFREVFEETGITKDKIKKVIENFNEYSFDKHYLTGKKIHTIYETAFAFEVKPDVNIDINNNNSFEHEEYKWVSFDDAIKILKWETNKESFEKLKKIIM